MRTTLVILVIAIVAVCLVHIRRAEMTVRHEIQRCCDREIRLRRELWDQQARIGRLTAPREVRRKVLALNAREGGFGAEEMASAEGAE